MSELHVADSSRPSPNSQKSLKKRDAIIRAAIEIINAKSYALATMTEIAASLGLRDGTLYYYFSSKRALVYACHVRSLERFEDLVDVSDRLDRDGAARLRYFVHGFLNESDTNGPQLYFGDHSYLNDEERSMIDQWADQLVGRLQRILDQGIVDGSIMPCETKLVVQLLLGMIIWLAKWTPSVEGLTPDRLMEAIGVLSFNGLETKQSSTDTQSILR